jgi:putative tryptophan/tyrosine transport system substrate-binding protein
MSAFGGEADITFFESPLSRSLLGVKRTCSFALHMSANDLKRTSPLPERPFNPIRWHVLKRSGAAMRRRDFITLFGGAVGWPLAARAQGSKAPVVGLLGSTSADAYASRVAFIRRGLSETGYDEGRNVAIEYRWAENQYDRLPGMAAELVRRQVDVIVAITTVAALAAKAATATIPVVFEAGGDPVALGLVASLSRPGGNLTGVSLLNVELGAKRLELLHEVIPTATIVGLLVNQTGPNAGTLSKEVQAAADKLGIQLHVLHANTVSDFDAVFATLQKLGGRALVIGTDPLFNAGSERLAALAMHYTMPTIYQYRPFAAAGGLLSYGGSSTEPFRQVGIYTGRVLKGEKPASLPVVQSTKVELIINLKTAKALGITVPLPLSGRADELIE